MCVSGLKQILAYCGHIGTNFAVMHPRRWIDYTSVGIAVQTAFGFARTITPLVVGLHCTFCTPQILVDGAT